MTFHQKRIDGLKLCNQRGGIQHYRLQEANPFNMNDRSGHNSATESQSLRLQSGIPVRAEHACTFTEKSTHI